MGSGRRNTAGVARVVRRFRVVRIAWFIRRLRPGRVVPVVVFHGRSFNASRLLLVLLTLVVSQLARNTPVAPRRDCPHFLLFPPPISGQPPRLVDIEHHDYEQYDEPHPGMQ